MTTPHDVIRIAAIGDIHCKKTSQGHLRPIFSEISDKADILLLCGDLTDYGLPEEAQILVKELTSSLKIPIVAVLGNHDFQSGKQLEVAHLLSEAGINVLDGEPLELLGIGFAGVKGFAGGFGNHALQPWGEESIKAFVHEAVEESLKLESALAKLRMPTKIVLMHYSPILATVIGEPIEIIPFLGSSRLEEPIVRYGVSAVFHGHAHHGCMEGKTSNNIPVYNVAMPLLQKMAPEKPPFHLMEIPILKEAMA